MSRPRLQRTPRDHRPARRAVRAPDLGEELRTARREQVHVSRRPLREQITDQGGGHKRAYRLIDFRRDDKDGVPAKVAHIEYDPNRTARIALLHYADGEKRYIIAPARLSQGDTVEAGPSSDIKPGNTLPLRNIPVGTVAHAIELRPGGGAKLN